MRPYEAYQQQQFNAMPRIDIILALYRKALDLLQRAHQALADGRSADARPLLARTQLIVTSLATGMAGGADEVTVNFLKLYEFVTDRLARGTIGDVEAAQKILDMLLGSFEAIRIQAADLEAQGKLPSLGREVYVHLTA